jgi:hypothetical protein
MSTDQFSAIQNVWGQIKDWPDDMRSSLASKILTSLGHPADRSKRTFADLMGLLATDQPPPSDEGVSRILDEERARKYG